MWLVSGPNTEASGTVGTKYKMMAVFTREAGPVLSVAVWDEAAGAYGEYVEIGRFAEENMAAYQAAVAEVAEMFCDNMIFRLQNCNKVEIDNLAVTVLTDEALPEPAPEEPAPEEGDDVANDIFPVQ